MATGTASFLSGVIVWIEAKILESSYGTIGFVGSFVLFGIIGIVCLLVG